MTEILHSREYRQQELKKIIRDLHDGKPLAEVKERFSILIKDIGPAEIAALEQALIREGLPEAEIKKLCDVHVQVFKEALDDQRDADAVSGHPVHTFRQENAAIEQLIGRYKKVVAKALSKDAQDLAEWADVHKELMTIENHYSRKENILFPYLEKYGISGPPSVMWSIHDEIRVQWKQIAKFIDQADTAPAEGIKEVIDTAVAPMLIAIGEMVYKENKIMLPMCLETLTESEWEEINRQSDGIGYTLYKPEREWTAKTLHGSPQAAKSVAEGAMEFDTGFLTQLQLNAMLKTLPVDMTFVDDKGKVCYFSQGRERIFTRTKAIIGRQVGMCHPPESVHVVMQIVDDFRTGKKDVAEFWINLHGMFVHIRYFAVRDEEGKYLGTLEVSQDIKALRQLQGEKRLLDDPNS
ncbi:MAG: DUF438 domain-containing protein [Peptococcaceae bacterium]|nr:DUF438 domain-containing protein [Peptococcaceae bacterium]